MPHLGCLFYLHNHYCVSTVKKRSCLGKNGAQKGERRNRANSISGKELMTESNLSRPLPKRARFILSIGTLVMIVPCPETFTDIVLGCDLGFDGIALSGTTDRAKIFGMATAA